VVVVHGTAFGCLSTAKRASFFGHEVHLSSVQITLLQSGLDVLESFGAGWVKVSRKEVQEGGCILARSLINPEQVFDAPRVDVCFNVQASGNSKCNHSETEFFQSCLCCVVLWIFA